MKDFLQEFDDFVELGDKEMQGMVFDSLEDKTAVSQYSLNSTAE